jgi:hypothetical protein
VNLDEPASRQGAEAARAPLADARTARIARRERLSGGAIQLDVALGPVKYPG